MLELCIRLAEFGIGGPFASHLRKPVSRAITFVWCIDVFQLLACLGGQCPKSPPAAVEVGVLRLNGKVGPAGQPCRAAQALHRSGKGFVERRVILNIHHLVRQLVEDHARQLTFRILDESAKQGVAAQPIRPTQCGIGGYAVDAGFQSLGTQRVGLSLCILLVKVAAVAHTARHRKTPGFERQRIGRGRHHVPDHRAPWQVGITLVAGVVRQLQRGDGKAPYVLCQQKALLQGRRRALLGQPVIHRARRLQ